jgi:hypothetical protein
VQEASRNVPKWEQFGQRNKKPFLHSIIAAFLAVNDSGVMVRQPMTLSARQVIAISAKAEVCPMTIRSAYAGAKRTQLHTLRAIVRAATELGYPLPVSAEDRAA